ncbi:MAG: hypothetical protein ACK5L9_11680 [Paracoccus sp. (in: a-proteobacteria)]
MLRLIDREAFDAVQSCLQANNPKVTPPRVVSGPNLPTGICYCGNCGGAMTLRASKSGRCCSPPDIGFPLAV